jgi:uncharacterized surface protein with fasciclin (FAS1) repeats
MIHRSTLFVAAALTAVLASGCTTVAAPPADVVSVAANTPELSTLSRLIQEAGLADTLRAAGPYTVFAPSNDAFKAVPAKTLEDLSRNKEQLKAVLTYHVLPAKVAAAEVKVGNAKTVQGANLALGRAGAIVTVEDAMVLRADVTAGNGVVHVIDRVLMPPRR